MKYAAQWSNSYRVQKYRKSVQIREKVFTSVRIVFVTRYHAAFDVTFVTRYIFFQASRKFLGKFSAVLKQPILRLQGQSMCFCALFLQVVLCYNDDDFY